MGSEETKLDLETVRLFKRDVQDNLERQARGRQQVEKRTGGVAATPRARERDMGLGAGAGTGDVFGMWVFILRYIALWMDLFEGMLMCVCFGIGWMD